MYLFLELSKFSLSHHRGKRLTFRISLNSVRNSKKGNLPGYMTDEMLPRYIRQPWRKGGRWGRSESGVLCHFSHRLRCSAPHCSRWIEVEVMEVPQRLRYTCITQLACQPSSYCNVAPFPHQIFCIYCFFRCFLAFVSNSISPLSSSYVF